MSLSDQDSLVLSQGLNDLGLPSTADDPFVKALQAGVREWLLWNPRLGLFEGGAGELIRRHILDSLAPWRIWLDLAHQTWDTGLPMADLGSGGGFPALLLAALLCFGPGSSQETRKESLDRSGMMELWDRQQRRINFLENARRVMGLGPQIRPVHGLLKDMDRPAGQKPAPGFQPDLPGPYRLVSARAFRPLDRLLLACFRAMLAPGGWLLLYKGRHGNTMDECRQAGLLPRFGLFDPLTNEGSMAPQSWLVPLKVPFLEEERCLVLVRFG